MPTFSDHALKELLAQYGSHADRVGSKLFDADPAKYRGLGLKRTDCITYVIECLEAGFGGVGDAAAKAKVRQLGKYGTKLASYLVKTKKWVGVYINPDEFHPDDGKQEHPYSGYLVKKNCKYYDIPMKYMVTNYRPTPKTNPYFKKVNPAKGEQKLDSVSYAVLSKVKFAFGLSKGGLHTWLFSKGKVYEVHWDELPTSGNLFEATELKSFYWNSGAIIVPKDQELMLAALSGLPCSG